MHIFPLRQSGFAFTDKKFYADKEKGKKDEPLESLFPSSLAGTL